MRRGRHTICAILLVALGCGETGRVTAGKGRQRQLPKETLQQIVHLSRTAGPWAPATPAEVRLRRRLFDYEDKLLRAGKGVPRPGKHAEKLAGILSVETAGPATVQVGRTPEIRATFRNLSKKPLRLLVWGSSWRSQFVSSDGRLLRRMWPVQARAARASAVQFPRPEDYVTVAPGASLTVDVPLPGMPLFIPPGRYHVTIWYALDPRSRPKPHEPAFAGELAGRTMAIEFVEGPELGGLACELKADKTQVPPGGELTFDRVVRNTTGNRYLTVARNRGDHALSVGGLCIRDTSTGKTLHLPDAGPRKAHPDGYSPWYRREDDYLRLRPGERLHARLVLDPALRKRHADFFQPGREYEATLRYANNHDWYLRDGQVGHCGNVWFGRIASRPVRFRVAPAKRASLRRPPPPSPHAGTPRQGRSQSLLPGRS